MEQIPFDAAVYPPRVLSDSWGYTEWALLGVALAALGVLCVVILRFVTRKEPLSALEILQNALQDYQLLSQNETTRFRDAALRGIEVVKYAVTYYTSHPVAHLTESEIIAFLETHDVGKSVAQQARELLESFAQALYQDEQALSPEKKQFWAEGVAGLVEQLRLSSERVTEERAKALKEESRNV